MRKAKTVTIAVKGEKEVAAHFLSWLCGQGEQQYWDWMEIRESEQDGDITITGFDYDFDKCIAVGSVGRVERE